MTAPVLCPAVQIEMADATPVAVSWVNIAVAGEFKGHPAGDFALNRDVYAELIRNFRRDPNGRVPVDFDHLGEVLEGSVAQKGAPAPAWVTDLKVEGDRLYAKWEWVDAETVERVRKGQFRWVSPAITFGAVDQVTGQQIGPRLSSVAITNRPFLPGLEPLTARDPAAAVAPSQTRTASLPTGAVHTPRGVGDQEKKAMEPETKKAEATAEAKRMEAAAESPAELRARAAAEYRASNPFVKRMRKLFEAGDDADEDDLAEKVEQYVKDAKGMRAEMTRRLEAEAEQKVAARVDGGAIADTDQARARAKAICLRDRAEFDELFPEPKGRAATALPSASGVSAADKALLSARVLPRHDGAKAQATFGAEGDAADYDRALDALTMELFHQARQQDPKADVSATMMSASRAARHQLASGTLARMAR